MSLVRWLRNPVIVAALAEFVIIAACVAVLLNRQ